ncbi:MAG: hypothetical protein NTW95_04450 [Candidatus Aminicenantes bacterium]|nr:hypothetical protein [Candidatus Aminicenantes bacterium]
MKRITYVLSGLLLAAALLPATAKIDFSGRVKLFASAFLDDNPKGQFFSHGALDFASKRLELRLKFAGDLSDRVSYQARFDAYAYPGDLLSGGNFPEAGILGSALSSEYFELNLYEASVKVVDFLLPHLDLTFGKQRIQWGTADKMNVVDNLNPVDFANFFTFDPDYFAERRPQTAVNLEYYLGNNGKLQLVWLLQNPLSPFPFGYGTTLAKLSGLENISAQKYWGQGLEQTAFGVRLSRTVWNIDFALSFYNGNSSLPVLKGLDLCPPATGTFYYPRLQVAGFDCAGEFKGIGFWGEAALVAPENVTGSLRVPLVIAGQPVVIENSFRLLEKNYWKYVMGLDYNFGGGFYANLQFLHGFFDEFAFSADAEKYLGLGQGRFFGALADYLFGRLEYKSGNEKLKLKASGLLEMNAAGTAFALLPEAEFRIADAVVAQLGGFWLLAGDAAETKFGMFKSDSLVFLGMKIDF